MVESTKSPSSYHWRVMRGSNMFRQFLITSVSEIASTFFELDLDLLWYDLSFAFFTFNCYRFIRAKRDVLKLRANKWLYGFGHFVSVIPSKT